MPTVVSATVGITTQPERHQSQKLASRLSAKIPYEILQKRFQPLALFTVLVSILCLASLAAAYYAQRAHQFQIEKTPSNIVPATQSYGSIRTQAYITSKESAGTVRQNMARMNAEKRQTARVTARPETANREPYISATGCSFKGFSHPAASLDCGRCGPEPILYQGSPPLSLRALPFGNPLLISHVNSVAKPCRDSPWDKKKGHRRAGPFQFPFV